MQTIPMPTNLFQNSMQKNMSFDDMFECIHTYIKERPDAQYCLAIGTDSQRHGNQTRFITGIMIHRIGSCSWTCRKESYITYPLHSTKEKISLETSFTEEIAYQFTDDHKLGLMSILDAHGQNFDSLRFEGHLDIGRGNRNGTHEFIDEMVPRIAATGFQPVIKPYSFVASGYANRYTK